MELNFKFAPRAERERIEAASQSEQDDWEALRDSVADEIAHLGAVNCLPDRFDEDEWSQIERALVAVGKFYRDKYAHLATLHDDARERFEAWWGESALTGA